MSGFDKRAECSRRFSSLASRRAVYEPVWRDIITYVMPELYDLLGNTSPGLRVGRNIFDGTAISALQLFADGLHGYLISASMRWFGLKLPNTIEFPGHSMMRRYNAKRLDELPEVKEWLEDCEDVMFSAFQRSNFYQEMVPYFLHGGSIGTTAIYSEEDVSRGRIVFSTRHPGEIYIDENGFGEIDTVFRKFKMNARSAAKKFGADSLSPTMKQASLTSPYNEYWFYHATFPRDEVERYETRSGAWEDMPSALNKPFISVWWDEGKTGDILLESGYNENPYAVWRYARNTRWTYGWSPAYKALSEIFKLNSMAKDLLEIGHRAAYPPMKATSDLRGNVQIGPKGMTWLSHPKAHILEPVNIPSQYPVSEDQLSRVEKRVKDAFHTDFFLMLTQAAFETSSLTATQVHEMMGEKAAVLGSMIDRLTRDCLNPVIDRVFEIEGRAGRLPAPPQILIEAARGYPIEVDYYGPLAQAQKRLFKTQGIETGLQAASPVIQFFPECADWIDQDETIRELLAANGFPQKCVRTEDEVMNIRQEKQKAAMTQMGLQMAGEIADKMPSLSKGIDANSVIGSALGMSAAGGGETGNG